MLRFTFFFITHTSDLFIIYKIQFWNNYIIFSLNIKLENLTNW